ncbi:hypothetical protein RIVM261_046670 [Rivularia sp. IAM M-261]|nr:hypothetical protein RIVM261_046670 [Rivularia sp. IAM M-261]
MVQVLARRLGAMLHQDTEQMSLLKGLESRRQLGISNDRCLCNIASTDGRINGNASKLLAIKLSVFAE